MASHFARLSVPSVVTGVLNFMVLTTNTIFAGNFKDDSATKLAAVGLGSMIVGMFCRHIMTGIASAIETLVAPCYGQG